MELTEGMTFPDLLIETASQMPRDATVIALVSEMNLETAIALGSLKKNRGFSVVAIVKHVFPKTDSPQTTGPLFAENIGAMHLKDEDSIRSICERQAMMI